MTLPTLHWVRQNRPEMKIGLVVGSWAKPMIGGIAELYDACYFADHFMLDRSTRPLKEKLVRHRQSWKLADAEIRRDGYDAAIECYPFLQSSIPLLYASGIPVRAGFTSGGFGPLLTHKARWVHASRPFHDFPRDLLRMLFSDRPSTRNLIPTIPSRHSASDALRPPMLSCRPALEIRSVNGRKIGGLRWLASWLQQVFRSSSQAPARGSGSEPPGSRHARYERSETIRAVEP